MITIHLYTLGLYEKAMPNGLTLPEKLACAKEAGYDYMELSVDASEEKIHRIYWTTAERNQLRRDMEEIGVPIDSICLSALTKFALGDLDEEKSQRGMEILQGTVILAHDLGVRLVMIPGYDIYYGTSTQETTDKYIKNLKLAVQFAAKYGVILAFETMENDFMNTTEKAMTYVNLVQSPYLQIYPDCGNITNATVAAGTDICDDLPKGAGHLVALHLKETVPGVYREVPYGTGHVNFPGVIQTAWSLGIRKYVTEFWDIGQENWREEVISARKTLGDLLDEIGV